MIDFTWKLFRQTGNIETYLILKELEENEKNVSDGSKQQSIEVSSVDTHL